MQFRLSLIALVVCLFGSTSWANIAHVTGTGTPHTQHTTTTTSCAVTYTPASAGNAIVFTLTASVTTISSVTMSDNATGGSSSYTNIAPSGVANGTTAIVFMWITTSVKSGATSFTASWTTSSRNSCNVVEYSGVAAIGATNGTSGSASPLSVNTVTNFANSWVVMGGGERGTGTYGAGTTCSPTATCTLEDSLAGGGTTTTGVSLADDGNVSSASTTVTTATTTTGTAWAVISAELSSAVAVPTFGTNGGSFNNDSSTTITSASSGATICYTTDGSTPAASTPGTCSAGSTLSNGGTANITATGTVVKALATQSGFNNSAVATSNAFTLTVGAITDSPGAGTYTSTQSVTLSVTTTTGATIHYTTDGTTPTCASTTYSSAISVSSSETIKALGCKTNYISSSVLSSSYIINSSNAVMTFSLLGVGPSGGGGGGGGATPVLVNAMSASNTGSNAVGTQVSTTCATNVYCTHLAWPSLAGNLLVAGVTWNATASNFTLSSVTDDKSNTWTCLSAVSNGNFRQTVCYVPNATTGTYVVKGNFSGAVTNAAMQVFQFNNVTSSTPVDVSSSASISASGTSVAAGSMTTTAAKDLIIQIACRTQTPTETNAFTKGAGFTKLTDDMRDGCVSQYQVQSSAGAINPTLTWDASGGTTYAVAFKSSTQGTAPSGMYIVHEQSSTTAASPTSVSLAFPSSGNLLVNLASCGVGNPSGYTGSDMGLETITDSSSNPWQVGWATWPITDGVPNTLTHMSAATNATTSDTLTMALTLANTNDCTLMNFDIAGAATDSPATHNVETSTAVAGATFTSNSSVTPGITSGLAIAVTSDDGNTCLSATSPSGANFFASTTGGELISGPWPVDQNNCYGVVSVSSNAAQTWTWGLSDTVGTAVGMNSGDMWGFADPGATKSGQSVSFANNKPCGATLCQGTITTTQNVSLTPATGSSFTSGTLIVGGEKPMILVAVALASSSATVSTSTPPSWSLGNGTVTSAVKVATNGTAHAEVWCIPNPVAGPGTVTVTLSASVAYQADIAVFNGVGACPTADAATATGNQVTTLTPSVTNLTSADATFGIGALTVSGDLGTNNTAPFTSGTTLFHNDTTTVNAEVGYHLGTGNLTYDFTSGTGQTVAGVTVRLQATQ